ncbi:Small hydrophilic protein OS=Streptomyces griseorubiginosus OX=67304 GN=DWG14_06271 PE=4 SV=1 [Streptomyces griseorubiginosus]
MAKNKKQNRKQPQSERGPQAPQHSATEPQSEQHATQVTPGDVARKGRQKSFGHN